MNSILNFVKNGSIFESIFQSTADELFAYPTSMDVGRKRCHWKYAAEFTHDTWNP